MPNTKLLFRDDAYQTECTATVTAVAEDGIRLSDTVFYALSGGQPGDTGVLVTADGREVRIVETRKGETPDDIRHIPAPDAPALAVGDTVTARIDWEHRHRFMRLHTALHLLSVVLPYPVTGGNIDEQKARLDFALESDVLPKEEIEARLNALVAADHPVRHWWITDEELLAKPELVKTMSVQPPMGFGQIRLIDIPGVDLQPCGGTHVARTGEIGTVSVLKMESKGRQNKRVVIGLA